MARCSDAEWHDTRAYEAAVLTIVNDVVDHLQHGSPPLVHLFGARGEDPVWRTQLAAEYRSWRTFLDAVPEEAPVIFAGAHTRMLRWMATVAAGGDALASAVEARDLDQLLTASQTLLEHERLYEAMIIALDRAIERARQ